MTAPARLTGLRLLGFKSFAERTTVEFGAGISAIVGPNGSGKSNLADALRWTLGEAGRSLRTRRAEDVIFAGSSARRATSMADVTLLLDNRDRLLPVDYGEIELGRRLYRSGENEYLLNRQRVRLRDLIELLDAGNLADNAFLFIGQGMVDQALALRPEERRPLFEEAAGVRRHERRRRQAEGELTEAETNLERLRDVLAELRPQARRLAAQAEQLRARRSAGHDLAEALVAAAHSRWQALASAAEREQAAVASAHAEADSALSELRAAEDEGQRISRSLAERAERERAQRLRLDEQRARTVDVRLAASRVKSEQAAVLRDRQRIDTERKAVATRRAEAQAVMESIQPTVDPGLAGQIGLIDAEIEALRGDTGAAQRPTASALPAAERAAIERRQSGLRSQVEELTARLSNTDASVADAERARQESAARSAEARRAFGVAEELDRVSHAAHDAALAEERRVRNEHAELDATLTGLRLRLDGLDDELGRATTSSLARAVRARGGKLAAEGLEVDPEFRSAVAAALGDAAQAWLVDDAAAPALPRDGGTLVLRTKAGPDAAEEAQLELARSAGGGRLTDAIRRDPQGQVSRLLARTLWVGRLEDALRLRERLAAGWQVVTIDGQLLTDDGILRLAASDRFLAVRADQEALSQRIVELDNQLGSATEGLRAASDARARVTQALQTARAGLDDARRQLAVADEVERTTQRRHDAVQRDQGWQRARLAGLQADAAELDRQLAELPDAPTAGEPPAKVDVGRRMAELRARREDLARILASQEARERTATDAVSRAEVILAIDGARTNELDAEIEVLAEREAEMAGQDSRLAADLAAAQRAEQVLSAELDRIAGDAGHDRALLIAAEARAGTARERLRVSEARSRTADRS